MFEFDPKLGDEIIKGKRYVAAFALLRFVPLIVAACCLLLVVAEQRVALVVVADRWRERVVGQANELVDAARSGIDDVTILVEGVVVVGCCLAGLVGRSAVHVVVGELVLVVDKHQSCEIRGT